MTKYIVGNERGNIIFPPVHKYPHDLCEPRKLFLNYGTLSAPEGTISSNAKTINKPQGTLKASDIYIEDVTDESPE